MATGIAKILAEGLSPIGHQMKLRCGCGQIYRAPYDPHLNGGRVC